MAKGNETFAEQQERERQEYLKEANANNDQQVEQAQAARASGGLSGFAGGDGASKEASLQAVARARAAGAGITEDDPRVASSQAEAKEKGWFGFSPTGAGENDHPVHRTGRLGSLGEFDPEQPFGVAGTGANVAAGQSKVSSGSGTDAAHDEGSE